MLNDENLHFYDDYIFYEGIEDHYYIKVDKHKIGYVYKVIVESLTKDNQDVITKIYNNIESLLDAFEVIKSLESLKDDVTIEMERLKRINSELCKSLPFIEYDAYKRKKRYQREYRLLYRSRERRKRIREKIGGMNKE